MNLSNLLMYDNALFERFILSLLVKVIVLDCDRVGIM